MPIERRRAGVKPSVELWTLTDAEERMSISIAPARGAEVASWRVRTERGWRELLERAEDYAEAEGWQGRAPWLFPAVGRHYDAERLRAMEAGGPVPSECSWLYKGQRWPMPIHGFARLLSWEVETAQEEAEGPSLTCLLRDGEATRPYYPFGFELRVTYRVNARGWRATVSVLAAEGQEPMPLSLGNHITVSVPFAEGSFEEYLVVAPTETEYELSRFGLPTGTRKPFPLRDGVPLSDARLYNRMVGDFDAGECWVELRSPSGERVRMAQREATSWADPSILHFVFYAVPQRRFFCPEPWLGRPNGLNTGEGVVLLSPGERLEWEMEAMWLS